MGMTSGPRLLKEGLRLNLDAANPRSFPGVPTVNLFSNPTLEGTQGSGPTSWSHSGSSSTRQLVPSTVLSDVNAWETDLASGNTGWLQSSAITLVAGKTYSLSIWVERFLYQGGNFPILSLLNTDISAGHRSIGRTTFSNETPTITTDSTIVNERVSITFTVSSTTTTASVRIGSPHGSSIGYLRIRQPQLEEQEEPSPFVSGTRGTTRATGGGWQNRVSSVEGHGELFGEPTHDGQSVIFGGNIDRVITDLRSLGPNTSWLAWVNRSSSMNSLNMFMGGTLPYFGIRSNTAIIFSNRLSGSQRTIQAAAVSNPDNQWLFFAFTTEFDGSDTVMKTYVNGSLVDQGSFPGQQTPTSTALTLGDGRGNLTPWYPFNGKISNAQVYNRALSPEEIRQNFQAHRSRFGV